MKKTEQQVNSQQNFSAFLCARDHNSLTMEHTEQVKLNLPFPPKDDFPGEIKIIEMHNSYPLGAKNGRLWRKVEGKKSFPTL